MTDQESRSEVVEQSSRSATPDPQGGLTPEYLATVREQAIDEIERVQFDNPGFIDDGSLMQLALARYVAFERAEALGASQQHEGCRADDCVSLHNLREACRAIMDSQK